LSDGSEGSWQSGQAVAGSVIAWEYTPPRAGGRDARDRRAARWIPVGIIVPRQGSVIRMLKGHRGGCRGRVGNVPVGITHLSGGQDEIFTRISSHTVRGGVYSQAMTDPATACPDCQEPSDPSDNYCRNCGMYLAATRELTYSEPALPTRTRPPAVPVPVRRAATAIAVGAAVQVGMSMAGKYLLRQAAKQALTAPLKARNGRSAENGRSENGGKREVVRAAEPRSPEGLVAVKETVVVQRAWVRR